MPNHPDDENQTDNEAGDEGNDSHNDPRHQQTGLCLDKNETI